MGKGAGRVKTAQRINRENGKRVPKARALAERGAQTAKLFLEREDALYADCVSGRLTPHEVNAASKIAANQIKMLDLAYRYRQYAQRGAKRVLAEFMP